MIFPVSFNFEILLKMEITISPNWLVLEITKIKRNKINLSCGYKLKKTINGIDNIDSK